MAMGTEVEKHCSFEVLPCQPRILDSAGLGRPGPGPSSQVPGTATSLGATLVQGHWSSSEIQDFGPHTRPCRGLYLQTCPQETVCTLQLRRLI